MAKTKAGPKKNIPEQKGKALRLTTLVRREKVKELFIDQHMSQRKIAKELKVALSTVNEDVQAICREILAEAKSEGFLAERLGKLVADHERVVKASWDQYVRAGKEGNRGAAVAALRSLDGAHRNLVDNLTRLGIWEAAPEKVELSTADQVVAAALGHLRRAKGAKAK